MATIVRNVDGCDTEHEMLLLQEYGEEVMSAGWNPQLAQAAISAAERTSNYAGYPGRAAIPEFIPVFAPLDAMQDEFDLFAPLPSAAIPKCP